MDPVTGLIITPFELANETQVHWATLELDGAVCSVVSWVDPEYSFALLCNNWDELDKVA